MMPFIQILSKKGFRYALNLLKRKILIGDEKIWSGLSLLAAYDTLQKYKQYVSLSAPEVHTLPTYPNKIWVCWLQGIDQAPLVVKKCVESIYAFTAPQEVILITAQNFSEYVQLPEYILQKWQRKIISDTHFSDLLRITLLYEQGGIWIDATTFLSGPLPEYIKKADLFCFKSNTLTKLVASSWFIAAKPYQEIIRLTKEFLYAYWKKENKLIAYCTIHLFFTMSIELKPENQKQWKSIPYFDDSNAKLMQNELFTPFNPERWKQITDLSSIHKLSYKFKPEEYKKEGTLYDVIVKKR